VLRVSGVDVVDVAKVEDTRDEEPGICESGDGVSTSELDAVSWTGVGVVSDDAMDSDDGDALITGATVEEIVSVSVNLAFSRCQRRRGSRLDRLLEHGSRCDGRDNLDLRGSDF